MIASARPKCDEVVMFSADATLVIRKVCMRSSFRDQEIDMEAVLDHEK